MLIWTLRVWNWTPESGVSSAKANLKSFITQFRQLGETVAEVGTIILLQVAAIYSSLGEKKRRSHQIIV